MTHNVVPIHRLERYLKNKIITSLKTTQKK